MVQGQGQYELRILTGVNGTNHVSGAEHPNLINRICTVRQGFVLSDCTVDMILAEECWQSFPSISAKEQLMSSSDGPSLA